jgi:hypothetical protein
MAQRSLYVVTKVYYMSMSCFATVSRHMAPLAVLRFPPQSGPFCTMWFRQFTQNVTKTGHKDRSHPHSTEQDTQPIAYLISKQVIPYRTRGGTCCPVVSTPKIQSLADSSMTNHITWQNPAVSTIPILLKSQHRSSPWSKHISMDGRPPLTKTQGVVGLNPPTGVGRQHNSREARSPYLSALQLTRTMRLEFIGRATWPIPNQEGVRCASASFLYK